MKKILVYRGLSPDCDVLAPSDYRTLCSQYHEYGGGNVGNKLFFQAALKYITNDYTEYSYAYYDEQNFVPFARNEDVDFLNENYDLVLMPQANIFTNSSFCKNLLSMWAAGISRFKIPVFVMGVGVQSDLNPDISLLVKSIGDVSKKFINAVYETGGNFSLRGNITKQFFDALGFQKAVVTGCPSLFQNGRSLIIPNDKVPPSKFRPAVNGFHALFYKKQFRKIFDDYPSSVYLDQDEGQHILYDSAYFTEKSLLDVLREFSVTELNLISGGRYFLFYDLCTRFDFLRRNVHFSYGSRIHGNIMALLNGIPSFVLAIDSRTFELADYFGIPHSEKLERGNLYDLYCSLDWSEFNSRYPSLFDRFESFLLDSRIIEKPLGDFSLYDSKISELEWQEPEFLNSDLLSEKMSALKNNASLFSVYQDVHHFLSLVHGKMVRR